MTAPTPGRVFRDTLRDRWAAHGHCIDTRDYSQLPDVDREDLEAAVQAGIDAFLAGDSVSAQSIREALAAPALAAAMAQLAAGMHAEADASGDDRVAATLHEYASRIRQAIGPGAVLAAEDL